MNNLTEKFKDIHHFGVLVKNVEKTITYYNQIGIGPFKVSEIQKQGKDETVYGRKLKIAFAKFLGNISIELIQVEGKSFFLDQLETNGEGLHHIAIAIDSLDSEFEKSIKSSKIIDQGPTFAFVDFGYSIIIEFIARSRIEDINNRLLPKP